MIQRLNKGFNLIEIMIVLAIFILIISLVLPSLINFRKEQALKNTAENIVSLLNKAKSDSIASLNSSQYGDFFENDKAIYFKGHTFLSGEPENQILNFEPGTEVSIADGLNLENNSNQVVFPRLIGNVLGYGTIIVNSISEPTKQKVISISKTGTISLD
jgi:prepilin-type N-terminal cleavage/methylation domain-containing protein